MDMEEEVEVAEGMEATVATINLPHMEVPVTQRVVAGEIKGKLHHHTLDMEEMMVQQVAIVLNKVEVVHLQQHTLQV